MLPSPHWQTLGASLRAAAAWDAGKPVYRLGIMTQEDVPDVSRVERRCFPNPWPSAAYRRELQNPEQNFYVVLREVSGRSEEPNGADESNNGRQSPPQRSVPRRSLLPLRRDRDDQTSTHANPLIGFAGMWHAFDEVHITTIGVDPTYRGRGLGELLFLCMVDAAIARGANWLTLEVRVSNAAAQALYRKYGFSVQGTRRRYYSDNNEDALIMWSRALSDGEFRAVIEARRGALANRLATALVANGLDPLQLALGEPATP